MDAELKPMWVEALRGGKYKQGKSSLCSFGRFCCLGVLADVAGAVWVDGDHPHQNGESIRSADGDWLKDGFAGLSRLEQRRLAGMNDSGSSFSEIADYIEANL